MEKKIVVYANRYSSLKKTSVITKYGVEQNNVLRLTRPTVKTFIPLNKNKKKRLM